MKKYITLALLVFSFAGAYAEDNPAIEAMQDYLDFAEYAGGGISAEQLASVDLENILFVDTRNKEQYGKGHIPGAMNIEWRQILARRDEIPRDKTVVLYCGTGLLSSKAHFVLQVAGRDNVIVLRGGYLAWRAWQSAEKAQK